MKTIKLGSRYPPNLQAYLDKFGHLPSREAQKFKTMEELDKLAELAPETGQTDPQLGEPKNVTTGTLLDEYYGKR